MSVNLQRKPPVIISVNIPWEQKIIIIKISEGCDGLLKKICSHLISTGRDQVFLYRQSCLFTNSFSSSLKCVLLLFSRKCWRTSCWFPYNFKSNILFLLDLSLKARDTSLHDLPHSWRGTKILHVENKISRNKDNNKHYFYRYCYPHWVFIPVVTDGLQWKSNDTKST